MTNNENENTESSEQQRNMVAITYHREFDPERDSVSMELIDAVATINNADPLELSALAHFIDPDALDSLLQSRPDRSPQDMELEISFRYGNYLVEIDSEGVIKFSECDHI